MDEYRERVLGVKGAFLEHALEWASSQYPHFQGLAETVAERAGESPIVEKVLDALDKSSDSLTRDEALRIRQGRLAAKEPKQ